MNRRLTLVGGGLALNLDAWPAAHLPRPGIQAGRGMTGTGLPPVEPRWYEGAGDGATWRGSRVLSREIQLPLQVFGSTPSDLTARTAALARALDPAAGPARLSMQVGSETWWTDVVRSGGGDWQWAVDSAPGRWVRTTIELTAGDPYWTRLNPESFQVRQTRADFPFLPRLAEMWVGAGSAFGIRQVTNTGDADAWPVWIVTGPATLVALVDDAGRSLTWAGQLGPYEQLTIDTAQGTIRDHNGANRYAELDRAPAFWPIKPGESTITVRAVGVDDESTVTCQWAPRRWLVV